MTDLTKLSNGELAQRISGTLQGADGLLEPSELRAELLRRLIEGERDKCADNEVKVERSFVSGSLRDSRQNRIRGEFINHLRIAFEAIKEYDTAMEATNETV